MRQRVLTWLANAILRFPRAILAIALGVTAGSVYLATTHLPLHTDQDDLVSESLEYHHRYKTYLREFGDQEYLYLVVEVGNDLPRAKVFIRHFVAQLAAGGGENHFREVLYRLENPAIERSFLLYLSQAQLESVAAFVSQPALAPRAIAQWTTFADLFAAVTGQLARPVSSADRPTLTMGFTFMDAVLDGILAAVNTEAAMPPPGLERLFFGTDRAVDDEGFFLSTDGRFAYVLIMPRKDYATLAVIAEPLRVIRTALAATRGALPGIAAGLTGRPVLQADEMAVTNDDMTRGTLFALAAVACCFIGYFRRPTRPLLAVGTLAMGISWTYGFAALAIGHLNILSIVFAVILVGAGIEYGLQIVARYREELAAHGDCRRAITICCTQTGRGNLTACLTTAAAFFAALGTQFLALRELGWIAGVGILLCLAAMLTVLPAAMYLRDRRKRREELHTTPAIHLDPLERLYARPRLVLGGLAVLTIAGLPGLWRLSFDHNLLKLQAEGLESVAYELTLATETDQSTWVTPFIVDSTATAMTLAERVKKLPTVKRVETITEIVPTEQPDKLAVIRSLAPAFADLPSPPEGEAGASEPATLLDRLMALEQPIARLTDQAFAGGETEAVAALENIEGKMHRTREAVAGLASPEKATAVARLRSFESQFFSDLHRKLRLLAEGMDPQPIALEDLPEGLRRRYVSPNGRQVIYAYPKANLWEPDAMAAYIEDLRTIDPLVTGVPVEVYESSRLLERSFHRVAWIAFAAICALALCDFRNVRLAGLAIAPLGLGVLWLLEIMGWIGLPFNMANFFAVPILIGVGVDNGIQLIHRYRQEGEDPAIITRSTGTAVLLTSVTTLASFAMLCTAAHRGIWSLGVLMSIGTLTCLVGSLLFLPTLLHAFTRGRRDSRSGLRAHSLPGPRSLSVP